MKKVTKAQFDQAVSVGGIDFQNLDLSGLDFSNLDLSGYSFRGSNLTGCNFTNCNLTSVRFTLANLTSCDFTNANVSDVCFSDATLTGVTLVGAKYGLRPIKKFEAYKIDDYTYVLTDQFLHIGCARRPIAFWKSANEQQIGELHRGKEHRAIRWKNLYLPQILSKYDKFKKPVPPR